MAKKSTQENVLETENTMESNVNETTENTNGITVGNPDGDNILAAWRGLHHLFGAHVDHFDVTPEGVVAVGFTVDDEYDAAEIIDGISGRNRRVELVPSYFYLQGQEPEGFTSSLEMTKWMQQYFRKPGSDGKSPEFVKRAIATYKKEHAFPARKGRPKKIVRVDSLGTLDMTALSGVAVTELEKLLEVVNASIAARK